MSRHERRYQKQLERKSQKHAGQSPDAARMAGLIAAAAQSPIHEVLVPAKLFESGMGNLIFSRRLADGRVAAGAFLLDVFCLGAKDAFATIVTAHEYDQLLLGWSMSEEHQPMEPACFRKLVEGAIAYARDLGFSPHANYAMAGQLFGDVNTADCATRFKYGHSGKPFYIPGPHETDAQIQAAIDQLERHVGKGNFHQLILKEEGDDR